MNSLRDEVLRQGRDFNQGAADWEGRLAPQNQRWWGVRVVRWGNKEKRLFNPCKCPLEWQASGKGMCYFHLLQSFTGRLRWVAQVGGSGCRPFFLSVPGNRLTQKDNANSGVQFITPAGPRQSLFLAKDPNQHLWKSFIPHVYVSKPTTPNSLRLT